MLKVRLQKTGEAAQQVKVTKPTNMSFIPKIYMVQRETTPPSRSLISTCVPGTFVHVHEYIHTHTHTTNQHRAEE